MGDQRIELAYTSWDPSDEAKTDLPPIVLLHGVTADKMTWNKLAPRLAEATGRKVYAVDARNHGDSPWSYVFNRQVLTRDLDRFMETHKISKAALVGHSMGGMIAMMLALQKGGRVEKFVSEDMTAADIPEEIEKDLLAYIEVLKQTASLVSAEVDELEAKKIVDHFLNEQAGTDPVTENEDPDFLDIVIKKENDFYSWKANLEVIDKYLKTRNEPKLTGKYLGNALFLYGKDSAMEVANDESFIKELFPNANLVGIDGADHEIHRLLPDQFFEAVTKFLNSN